jgi:DNA repair photolyase
VSLIGIARLAAQASPLEAKREVRYLELPSRSVLNKCSSPRVPFHWTINPYRGCEFGCKYCYARYTHEFMELRDPDLFETRIFAKHFQPQLFRRELASVKPGEHVAIGTATDPYQPAERRFRVTRRILEVLTREQGLRISMITKSDLIARDADLIEALSRANIVHVTLTITTLDAGLARLLEPRAPRPDLRLRALAVLRGHGIQAGVFASPLLPGLNDSIESLRALGSAAAAAGACYFGGNVLFLRPCSKQVFLPFLEERFPRLAGRYRRQFANSDYLTGPYPETVQERLAQVRKECRLPHSAEDYVPPEAGGSQMTLF